MARVIGGRGPANVMKHLKGVKFPAAKVDLVNLVERNRGPESAEVIDVIGRLPEKEYSSVAEIMKEVSKV